MPSELAIVTRKEQNGECTSHSKACICFMFRMGMMYAAGKLAEREVTCWLVPRCDVTVSAGPLSPQVPLAIQTAQTPVR
jgi:hypothetical protein